MTSRTLTALVIALALAGAAPAQSYSLTEGPLADSCFRVEMDMSLKGEIKVQQDGKTVTMPQTASAGHTFLERILEAGKTGLADRSARLYQKAKADIVVGKDRQERTFRAQRTFMAAQRQKDQVFVFSPEGTLTREELELTEHFDTLSIPGLVPGREVKLADTWKVGNAAAQTLLDLDGMISQDLTCKLERVDGQTAQVSIAGTASGIALGATVKVKVNGTYEFDLKSRRLTALEWKQNDQRDQGPVTPAFSADVVIRIKRTPIEDADELNDVFLKGKLPEGGAVPDSMARLLYTDPQGHYELVHARDWHMVARSDRQFVMRLMDQGDFVAQVTITSWKKADPGKHLSEEEFTAAMAEAPGWEPEGTPDKGTVVDDPAKKYWIYRTSAAGTLNGVKAVQYFYLVAGPRGDQLVVAFTMPPAQAQKLNTRDLELIRGLKLGEPREKEVTSLP